MLFKLFSKKQKTVKENKIEKITKEIQESSKKITDIFNKTISSAQSEFISMKEKTKDLRSVNYELGLKHLENERLSEAIVRFRIIKKFWPDFYEAYYQLAYCLVLKGKIHEARKALVELLEKQPNFNPLANELLNYIDNILAKDENS